VRVAPPPSPDLLPIGRRVNTVESRLADRLRPLLQEWVDRELPRIAESVLRAEVRRMIQHAEETAEDRM
jgi:cell pole-organizing protein PopZ